MGVEVICYPAWGEVPAKALMPVPKWRVLVWGELLGSWVFFAVGTLRVVHVGLEVLFKAPVIVTTAVFSG